MGIKRLIDTDRARKNLVVPVNGLGEGHDNLNQPKDKATKMKSDQKLFHPVAPKRQASQNNRLANGTTIQNELAPNIIV